MDGRKGLFFYKFTHHWAARCPSGCGMHRNDVQRPRDGETTETQRGLQCGHMAIRCPYIHQCVFGSKLAGNGGNTEIFRAVEEKWCRPAHPKPVFALELDALPVQWRWKLLMQATCLVNSVASVGCSADAAAVNSAFSNGSNWLVGVGATMGRRDPVSAVMATAGLRACAIVPAQRAGSRPSWRSRTSPHAGQTRRHKTPTAESPPRPLRG